MNVEPARACEGDRGVVGREIVPAVGGDGEVDRGNLRVELPKDVVGAGVDVTQIVGEDIAAGNAFVKVRGPRSHPSLVVDRGANVIEMTEIKTSISLVVDDAVELGIDDDAAGGIKGKIHVVREVEDLAIGAAVKLTIVI